MLVLDGTRFPIYGIKYQLRIEEKNIPNPFQIYRNGGQERPERILETDQIKRGGGWTGIVCFWRVLV